ncbi:MAG: DUF4832 domain-containing protein [Armatimonadetes bacterium]|nr:DUF4832 domain-containing protein [Armatimonadota bacterium]
MRLARWVPETLRQTGFTPARYIAAYRRMIDAFTWAFPRARVFLNVRGYEAINDYAALRGLHFRQDGLPLFGPSADVGKRFYHPYAWRGAVCNYELHSGYEEMQQKGWGVRETFEKGLEDPISYLHINLMSYRSLQNASAEVKEAVTAAARRIGFRFTLKKLRCSRTLRLDGKVAGRVLIEHTWQNEGVAPCYASYALRWMLTGEQGRTVAEELDFPARPTTLWLPGQELSLKTVLPVPAQTPPGNYRLKVAMVEPENLAVRLRLGIAGLDAAGNYDLCPVPAERRAAGESVVYREGIEARKDATARTGKVGLRGPGFSRERPGITPGSIFPAPCCPPAGIA